MAHQDTEGFLNELAARVFSGDWRGYRGMVEDGMVNIGDQRSVVHLGDAMHRRALSSLSVRIRATGWDGLTIRVQKSIALGGNLQLVEALSTPTIGTRPAAAPFAEAYLLRHNKAGRRVVALLNPTSEQFWQSGGAKRDAPLAQTDTAGAITRSVIAMHQALHDDNLGAFLKWVDMPMVCCLGNDVVRCADATGVSSMVRQLMPISTNVASHDIDMIDMARFGDALVAARFEVQVTLRDGRRLSPYHNLYFLRQGPDGWRVALLASAAAGHLPPPEGARASQDAASAHGMNLKDN